MPLVVGGVLGAVLPVQLPEPFDGPLQRRGGRQVQDQRADLGAQEVVGAGGAQRGQARVLGAGQEVQHHVAVGEVADLAQVGGGQAADDRGEGGGPLAPLGLGQRLVAVEHGTERLGRAALGEELLRGADDVQGVALGLLAGGAPGGDAVAAEDAADRLRVRLADGGDVQAELEAGAAPRHPHHLLAEALLGQRLAVGRGGQGDAGVGVEVVDVGGVHQTVHGGVDGGGRAALAVQAVVERGDHLVLALHAGVDVLQRAQAVQAEHGETGLGQGAQVAAGALDPHQLDGPARDRVVGGALG